MSEQESAPDGGGPVVYVYGLVPADVEVKEDATGIGSPPRPLKIVHHEDVAALVTRSTRTPAGQFRRPAAHAAVLDSTATVAPVLPLRFGAVLTDTDAVVAELLEPYRDEFHEALEQLEGKVEFVVKASTSRTRSSARSSPTTGGARLRDVVREQPEDTTRDERLALGERISQALTAKREQDTGRIVEALQPAATAVAPREPTDDEEAGSVAVLISADGVDELDKAVARLIDDWQGRVEVTVTGPLAAYDFVKTRAPGTCTDAGARLRNRRRRCPRPRLADFRVGVVIEDQPELTHTMSGLGWTMCPPDAGRIVEALKKNGVV
ncbi:gas vesicle protein GvpFL [Rhodococcus hoagii]|nr:gas vesicle protein GvpFL [Prescottella equi]